MINELVTSYKSLNNITINISQAAIDNIVTKGYNIQFGARNMQRTIMEEIGGKIDTKIIEGTIKPGETVEI